MHDLKMIGVASVENGLYILKVPLPLRPSVNFCFTLKSFCSVANASDHIWHCRLGHPSHDRLQLLSRSFLQFLVISQQFDRDICHFAKQKQLTFPLSTSKSSAIFYLVHADNLGSYSY